MFTLTLFFLLGSTEVNCSDMLFLYLHLLHHTCSNVHTYFNIKTAANLSLISNMYVLICIHKC